MKCEIVCEGQACKNEAGFIVRTPWTTQLACEECAPSFKHYGVEQIGEYTCDWPVSGKECGKLATHYVEMANEYHRPLCDHHAAATSAKLFDDEFNPKLVPYKPPEQPKARIDKDGLWCHCGRAGKFRGGVETLPLCDEHTPAPPKTEPPPELPVTQTTSSVYGFVDMLKRLSSLSKSELKVLRRAAKLLLKENQT